MVLCDACTLLELGDGKNKIVMEITMKKNKRRTTAFLLSLFILIGAIPVQVQAASKKPVVTKLTLNKRQYVLKKGEKLKLKAAISTSGKKSGVVLKWKSSNKKVVSVNSKGGGSPSQIKKRKSKNYGYGGQEKSLLQYYSWRSHCKGQGS